jgi:hypothetical protein
VGGKSAGMLDPDSAEPLVVGVIGAKLTQLMLDPLPGPTAGWIPCSLARELPFCGVVLEACGTGMSHGFGEAVMLMHQE